MRLFAVLTLLVTSAAFGSEFSLRAFCPGDNPKQPSRRCLIGEIPNGTKVILLGSQGSETCVSAVIESKESINEVLGTRIPIAVLDPKSCFDFRFSLAHFNSNATGSYRRIYLPEITDGPLVAKVNAAVRAKASLIETRDGEHRTALSDTLPTVYAIPAKPEVYIAVYQNALIPGDETHVLYANGVVSKIHGAAKIVSVFALGEHTFVHYAFTCNLGCGYRGDFVVEIGDNGFSQVFYDSSWSA